MMAHMAMFGICEANKKALLAWYQVYEGQLGIALPDTFTTDVFFRDFDADIAKLYTGLRWDSGDPDEFTLKTKAHYESLGLYNPNIPLLYSDGLDDDQSIELQGKWANVFNVAYGIGTFFSNDVGVKPLQIVIKLLYVWIDGERIEVVKLSDTPGKHNGSKTAVAAAKAKLGLT
jgi:nicotinate phosphoribosyltransferase